MKHVLKPWGKEVWMELNDHYCYKQIHLSSGTRTSFQYHREKLETNFVMKGTAEVWLEDHTGEIQKIQMAVGDFFTVRPFQKHRVIAHDDVVLLEVSTPQVDDVVRIDDDTNRPDGRIESEHIKE